MTQTPGDILKSKFKTNKKKYSFFSFLNNKYITYFFIGILAIIPAIGITVFNINSYLQPVSAGTQINYNSGYGCGKYDYPNASAFSFNPAQSFEGYNGSCYISGVAGQVLSFNNVTIDGLTTAPSGIFNFDLDGAGTTYAPIAGTLAGDVNNPGSFIFTSTSPLNQTTASVLLTTAQLSGPSGYDPVNNIMAGISGNVALTLGNPVATSLSPALGTVGGPLPTIIITGGSIPNGTAATFTPFGGLAIPGTIQNGNFVPTPGSTNVISSGSSVGQNLGTLSTSGASSVTVPTGFTAASTSSVSSSVASVSSASSVTSSISISSISSASSANSSSSISSINSSIVSSINSSSSTNSTPIKGLSINDPYICGSSIFGKVDGDLTQVKIISVVITDNTTNKVTTFNPTIDSKGGYVVEIQADNANSLNYVAPGLYTVSYSVQDVQNNIVKGSDYQANIKKSTDCTKAEITASNNARIGNTVTTGAINQIFAAIYIPVLMMLICYIYNKSKKTKINSL